MKIEIESPGEESYAVLHDRLVRFNQGQAAWGQRAFTVTAYDDAGALIGGVHGIINMGLVDLRGLWVDPPHRKTGLGARIVIMLEDHARSLGAARAALYTYDWQARGFYEKLGYTVFGTLVYPTGATRYFMQKDLAAA